MLRYLITLIQAPARRRDEQRLAELRKSHFRWRGPLYGRKVQITRRILQSDVAIGEVGQVLTEAEHGIKRHPGWAECEPDFPGVRDFHYLVRFGTNEPLLLLAKYELAPA
jgi:hypothetical protein